MEAWYPFPTDTTYIRSILYISQVFAILQTGFGVTVDFMIAMFFWYATARLEMLERELQQITHESQVKLCILKHQEIIRYIFHTNIILKKIVEIITLYIIWLLIIQSIF